MTAFLQLLEFCFASYWRMRPRLNSSIYTAVLCSTKQRRSNAHSHISLFSIFRSPPPSIRRYIHAHCFLLCASKLLSQLHEISRKSWGHNRRIWDVLSHGTTILASTVPCWAYMICNKCLNARFLRCSLNLLINCTLHLNAIKTLMAHLLGATSSLIGLCWVRKCQSCEDRNICHFLTRILSEL